MCIRESQSESMRFYLLVHSPNVSSSQAVFAQSQEARCSLLVPRVGGRDPSPWIITCHLPECVLVRAGLKVEEGSRSATSIWDVVVPEGGLACYATNSTQ